MAPMPDKGKPQSTMKPGPMQGKPGIPPPKPGGPTARPSTPPPQPAKKK